LSFSLVSVGIIIAVRMCHLLKTACAIRGVCLSTDPKWWAV